MLRDHCTPSRLSLIASWQSLPRPPHEPSVPVLYHRPSVIARQRAANRAASATIRTWDGWIALVAVVGLVLVASHVWGR